MYESFIYYFYTKPLTITNVKGTIDEVNNSLVAEKSQQFQFTYDSESGKYGYKAKVEGADTFFPFSRGVSEKLYSEVGVNTYTFSQKYNTAIVIFSNNGNASKPFTKPVCTRSDNGDITELAYISKAVSATYSYNISLCIWLLANITNGVTISIDNGGFTKTLTILV